MDAAANGKAASASSGSKTLACLTLGYAGTREALRFLPERGVCRTTEEGERQMRRRESRTEPSFKFTRLQHLMSEELLRGCFQRLLIKGSYGQSQISRPGRRRTGGPPGRCVCRCRAPRGELPCAVRPPANYVDNRKSGVINSALKIPEKANSYPHNGRSMLQVMQQK
jgi:hypothetical protein